MDGRILIERGLVTIENNTDLGEDYVVSFDHGSISDNDCIVLDRGTLRRFSTMDEISFGEELSGLIKGDYDLLLREIGHTSLSLKIIFDKAYSEEQRRIREYIESSN